MAKTFVVKIAKVVLPFMQQGLRGKYALMGNGITDAQCIKSTLSMHAILGGLNPDLCNITVKEINNVEEINQND